MSSAEQRIRTRRTIAMILITALGVAAGKPQLEAQGLQLDLQSVAAGLARPLAIAHAGDGTGRLFIAEQAGRILILESGTVLPTPFLDISTLVEDSGNEEGFLGLAFHPDYATNGYFFVSYTELESNPPPCPPAPATCDANSVVARYKVSSGDPDIADPASAQILFKVNQPRKNHNGGNLAFGPDGYLYIGFGDGGGGGDPYLNGQDLSTLHGSILRIDVDASPPTQPNGLCGLDPALYGIPAGNPFVHQAGACDEIWAYGLRNPWRFSFDRETGALFIGDVGQNAIEEIDFQDSTSTGGKNYGWNCYEGSLVYPGGSTCSGPIVFPILEYPHSNPGDPTSSGDSVTGGYRYRGAVHPQLDGVYLYADYIEGRIWGTVPRCDGVWESRLLLDEPFLVSSFGEDESGELYLTEFLFSGAASQVYRVALEAGSGGPLFEATPTAIDFGSVEVGTRASRQLTLTNDNAGPEALIVDAMNLSGTVGLHIDPTGGANPCHTSTPCLSPGSGCTVSIVFSPSTLGPLSGSLDVSGNTPPASVALTGQAVACSTSAPRVLPGETVSDTRTEEACGTLAAGPYEIARAGVVAFRAGHSIELRNGFSVLGGGSFTGEIDPALAPP